MKVGIVVVYLVSEENEKLLDLHLSQIEKHTQIPFSIYGSVNRLISKFRKKLERHPKVRICKCPTTGLRDLEEHSFYLDHLVRYAVEDGASHVVILHVDSFPIRSDWIELLAEKLSDPCVLVAIQESKYSILPSTACMMFHRDFYLKYRPTFLPSREDRALPEFTSFMKEFDQAVHSGTGYTFKAYLNGLSWHHMLRSNKGEDHHIIGSVYDDLVFHLGAATRPMKHFRADFPIRSDWIELLAEKLSDPCVLVAIQESKYSILPSTACMMFHRDFYLKYRPTFLPSREDRALPEFTSFMKEFDQAVHSGTGYTFKAYLNGLSWHHMLRSNKGEDHHIIGSVYDDLVFHLGAATRPMKHFRADFPKQRERKTRNALRSILKNLSSIVLTQRAYESVKALLPRSILGFFVPQIRAHQANREAYGQVRARLLEDPKSYLEYLRTGNRE